MGIRPDDQAQVEADATGTPSKKPTVVVNEMLSPTALESSLIASYDSAPPDNLMSTFSPLSQTNRLGFGSPGRGDSSNPRFLLSPPRSDESKLLCGANDWSSPSSLGMSAFEGRFMNDAFDGLHLSRSPLSSPLRTNVKTIAIGDSPSGASAGGDGGVDRHAKEQTSSRRRDEGLALPRREVKRTENTGGFRSEVEPLEATRGMSLGQRGKTSENEQAFSAFRDEAKDPVETVTFGGGAGKERGHENKRKSPRSRDAFKAGDRERKKLEGGASLKTGPASRGRHRCRPRLGRTPDEHDEGPGPSRTPSGTRGRKPSAGRATAPATDGAADDTIMAASSLVAFQRPRVSEAPRIKGPLGTSALRVTLGTPASETGACSIGSSVKAKLSIPRTTPAPGAPDADAGSITSGQAAAGRAVNREGGGSSTSKGVKSIKSSLEKAAIARGMFDAVSPAAAVEENGTPYSVSRVGRERRADSAHGQNGLNRSKRTSGLEEKEPTADAVDVRSGGEVFCHTPRKQAGRTCASAGRTASGERSLGPCATPPALTAGTPCSGSRFRSAGDEESDYSDYEEVRTRRKTRPKSRVVDKFVFLAPRCH